jgi:hypothetical protein
MKNFYKVKWVVVWYRYEKLYKKLFDDYEIAKEEKKRHPHAEILYCEIKVKK